MANKELLLQLQNCFDRCKPIFIAMGDEVRLTIITALAWTALTGYPPGKLEEEPVPSADTHTSRLKGLSVKEITNTTKLSRPAISHHLKILKNAGLVDSMQTGTSNIYYITFDATTDLLHGLATTLYEIREGNE